MTPEQPTYKRESDKQIAERLRKGIPPVRPVFVRVQL